MKTRNIFSLALLGLVQSLCALEPVHSNTFAPNPCQPAAIIAPLPNTYGCYSFSATAPGTTITGGYYTWDFGDGNTGTGDFLYHCYSPSLTGKVYTVTITYYSAALCGFMPATQSYQLVQAPPDSSECVWAAHCYSLSALSLTMCPIITFPEMMYMYTYGDGTSVTQNATHQYISCGNYILTITSWDMNMPQNICHGYTAINIECASTPTITGLPERDRGQTIRLFPNPASEIITLESQEPINGTIVVDVTGREWPLRQVSSGTTTDFHVAELPAGAYFLKLHYKNGPEKHIKFIKE